MEMEVAIGVKKKVNRSKNEYLIDGVKCIKSTSPPHVSVCMYSRKIIYPKLNQNRVKSKAIWGN